MNRFKKIFIQLSMLVLSVSITACTDTLVTVTNPPQLQVRTEDEQKSVTISEPEEINSEINSDINSNINSGSDTNSKTNSNLNSDQDSGTLNNDFTFTCFKPAENTIAITFDDGPSTWTPKILDKLESENVKATFFVITSYIENANSKKASYVRRANDMGCEIGIHCYSHMYRYCDPVTGQDESEDIINNELYHSADILKNVIGKTPTLMRPPGGRFNKSRKYGFPSILWSVDSLDWKYNYDYVKGTITKEQAVESTCNEILNHVTNGSIILMHDASEVSYEAFCRVYDSLKAKGYKFATVSELLDINGEQTDGYYFYSTFNAGINGAYV